MIATRQLYEDSFDNILLLQLYENIEAMTQKYEQQTLCRYHREKRRRHKNDKIHRNKSYHYIYDKYVDKNDLFMRIETTCLFLLQLHSRKIIIFFFVSLPFYFYNSLHLYVSILNL